MEEVAYLDSVSLVAYDLPPGWRMALDERKAVNGRRRPARRSSIARSGSQRTRATRAAPT